MIAIKYGDLAIALVFAIQLTLNQASANDYPNESVRLEGELRDAQMRYRKFMDSLPSVKNVLASIDTGYEELKVHQALKVAALDTSVFSCLSAKKLQLVYNYYNSDGVKLTCARLLVRVNRAIGFEKLKDLLKQEQTSPYYRLKAAEALVEQGDPVGYPVVKRSISGAVTLLSRSAAFVITKFLLFEGQPYEKGNSGLVDVRDVVAKSEPKIRELFAIYEKSAAAKKPSSGRTDPGQ